MRAAKAIPVKLEGSRPMALACELDFTNSNTVELEIDLTTSGLECVRSIYIDNADGEHALGLLISGTKQLLPIPQRRQFTYPVVNIGGVFKITAYCNRVYGNKIVPLILYNFYQKPKFTNTYDIMPTTTFEVAFSFGAGGVRFLLQNAREDLRYWRFANTGATTIRLGFGVTDADNPRSIFYGISVGPGDEFYMPGIETSQPIFFECVPGPGSYSIIGIR